MIDQVVTSIGWQSVNDRETVIRKENIIESIPKLKKIQTQIADEYKGNIKKYIDTNGIESSHDVMVILRRMLRRNGRYVTYSRGSLKGLKSQNNSPVYLYKLI